MEPDETYKGWEIFFRGREGEDGMWEDKVEPNCAPGDGFSHYGVQKDVAKFSTRDEAYLSGMKKARKWIDGQTLFTLTRVIRERAIEGYRPDCCKNTT